MKGKSWRIYESCRRFVEVTEGLWKRNLEKEILCTVKLTKIVRDLFNFYYQKHIDAQLEFVFLSVKRTKFFCILLCS